MYVTIFIIFNKYFFILPLEGSIPGSAVVVEVIISSSI